MIFSENRFTLFGIMLERYFIFSPTASKIDRPERERAEQLGVEERRIVSAGPVDHPRCHFGPLC
jgi:hypothetical protein